MAVDIYIILYAYKNYYDNEIIHSVYIVSNSQEELEARSTSVR